MFRDHHSRPPHSEASVILAGRLRTGEQRIDAERDPATRERMIDFWIELLHTYEAAVDRERRQGEERAA